MKIKLMIVAPFTLVLLLLMMVSVSAEEFENEVGGEIELYLTQGQINSLVKKGFTKELIEAYILSGDTFNDLMKMEVMNTTTKYYRVKEYVPPKDKFHITISGNENPQQLEEAYATLTKVEVISYDEYKEEISKIKSDSGNNFIGTMATSDNGYTKTDYKYMSTTVTKLNNYRYRVSNLVSWFTAPKYTKTDIIGIGINAGTSPVKGTEWGYQKYYTNITGKLIGTIYYESDNNNWNRNGDYGLRANLKDDVYPDNYKHTIYMQYSIQPIVDNLRVVDAFGHYAHLQRKIEITPSFSIRQRDLTIAANIKEYYTEHPDTHAQINP
jgi:hypothetical protein